MIYRPEIDGLRAIAVLSVILTHAGLPWISGGFIGVDVFFVISGYLITCILLDDLKAGYFSIVRFYDRRARRILPALIVVVLACLPFAWFWMQSWEMRQFARSVVGVAIFASNFVFWGQAGYFDTAAGEKPLLHTWSLGVEEQFYLIFPGILWLIWRYSKSNMAFLIAGMALLSFGLAEWGWRNEPDANFFLIPFRAWELLIGSFAAIIVGWNGRSPNEALAFLGLILVVSSLFVFDEYTPFPSFWALPAVVGSALVITWGTTGTLVARALGWKPMVAIGLISYSAYLWHQPLFAFARIRLAGEPSPMIMAGLTLVTFFLAWVTWWIVEQPFRKRTLNVLQSSKSVLMAASASVVFLGGIGVTLRFVDEAGLRSPEFPGLSEMERRELLAGRLDGIRVGDCHYNKDVASGVTKFLEEWSCNNVDEPNLVSLPMGLYGDSHSGDKAFSIREAGFDVAQITAAGCPLIPEGRRDPHCDTLLEEFHVKMRELGVREVFISNRFEGPELNASYLRSIIDYWSDRYDRVFLFAPMPYYPSYQRALLMFPLEVVAERVADTYERDAFGEAIADIDLRNVILIDTYALFCGRGEGCSPVGEATKLVDESHLSAYGAKVLGENLADLPESPLHRRSTLNSD